MPRDKGVTGEISPLWMDNDHQRVRGYISSSKNHQGRKVVAGSPYITRLQKNKLGIRR